jgi:hypothetical protein
LESLSQASCDPGAIITNTAMNSGIVSVFVIFVFRH